MNKDKILEKHAQKIIFEEPTEDNIPGLHSFIEKSRRMVNSMIHGNCSVSAAWFQVNIMNITNQILNSHKVSDKRQKPYFDSVYDFHDIIEGTFDYEARKEDIDKQMFQIKAYLGKKLKEQLDLDIISEIGRAVFFLHKMRRNIF